MPLRDGLLGEMVDLVRAYRGNLPDSLSGREDRPRVAVILGAQVLRGGRPSPTLEARVRHAGRLYLRGRLDLLIPTGGEGDHPPTEAGVMSEILREMDVPEAAILREAKAHNTWDSAVEVAGIARRRGMREVLVVSDPLHCVRGVAAFTAAGLPAVAEPVYSSPMWSKKWPRGGQLLRESGALVWYRMKYGVGTRSRP